MQHVLIVFYILFFATGLDGTAPSGSPPSLPESPQVIVAEVGCRSSPEQPEITVAAHPGGCTISGTRHVA